MITSILIIAIVFSILALTSNPNTFIWGDSYTRKDQMSLSDEAKFDLL